MKKKLLIFWIIIGIIGLTGLSIYVHNVFRGSIIPESVLFHFGRVEIKWYGVIIVTGILLSYYFGLKTADERKINPDDLNMLIFFGIIFSIIGARTYYVTFQWQYYSHNLSEIVKTWHGGMAIHGAVLAVIIYLIFYTMFSKKYKLLTLLDVFASTLPLGQAIGRWGNFMNKEAYGSPTNLPWKMYIPLQNRMPGYEQYSYFHPTFLYESLCDISTFIFLYVFLRKRQKYRGEIIFWYLILYSIPRYFIEGLRLDSLYTPFLHLRIAQVMGVVLTSIGIIGLIAVKRKKLSLY
jgi:phosphatidylglycerol:prolipoprotein diacylglycerol transferase